ncbi:hypothetical protein [Haliangium sp. UPWRP_2]|uniref:hypothetical protein n=1 Tax=Haliangium sp. UPWRP_2 TaxID=1931276 RepID=UPI000D0E26F0|nr:hypothetical protein [Haliangium sp. UPWRP_2]PSM31712.1 hypothetical protein BVG81_003980 [Haliangium sp. UPWRP_2]
MNNKLDRQYAGAVAGLLATVIPAWSRWDDDNRRRINDNRDDIGSVSRGLQDLNSSGTMIRLRIPAVMDLVTGFGLANPMTLFPQPLPTNVPHKRPDIHEDAVSSVADFSWSPQVGSYDPQGNTTAPGDLATLALGMTYEESRCVLQGLLQSKAPNRHQKIQIYYAVNALIATLYKTKLSFEQFAEIWADLFNGKTAVGSVANPHHNPLSPPTIQALGGGIVSVTPLGLPDLMGYQYEHLNSDAAMKFRLVVGGATVNALSTLFQVQFGTPYVNKKGMPYQPVVTCSYSPFYIVNVTASSFQVQNLTALPAGQVVDFGLTAAAT